MAINADKAADTQLWQKLCDTQYFRLCRMTFSSRQSATWEEFQKCRFTHLDIAGRSILQQCFDCADIAAADRKVKGGETALRPDVCHVPAALVVARFNPVKTPADVADCVNSRCLG